MKRRHFISTAILAAMALPFAIQPAKAGAFLFVVLVILVVVGTVFYQLWKLCKKYLGDPPSPPPDKKGNNVSHGPALDDEGSNPPVRIPYKPMDSSCFCNIAPGLQGFLTPDGVTFYTGIFMANVYDSVDMVTWNLTGTITAWLSEGYIKIQNADQNGNVLSVVTTPDWNTESPLALFSPQCQPSPMRQFKMQSL